MQNNVADARSDILEGLCELRRIIIATIAIWLGDCQPTQNGKSNRVVSMIGCWVWETIKMPFVLAPARSGEPEQQQNVHVVGAQHLVLFGRGDEVADEIRPIVRPVLLEDLHETAHKGAPDRHTHIEDENMIPL